MSAAADRPRTPVARFVLAALAIAVAVADGIVLVGFTGSIPGTALPADPVAPVSVAASPAPELSVPPQLLTPSPQPPPSPAAPPPKAAPARPRVRPPVRTPPTVRTPPRRAPTSRTQAPGRPGRSSLAERCRRGEIAPRFCRDVGT